MEITLIIVSGITLITVVAAIGDYLAKTKVAQLSQNSEAVQKLEERIAHLERKVLDQESKIVLLEENIVFTTKLIENKR